MFRSLLLLLLFLSCENTITNTIYEPIHLEEIFETNETLQWNIDMQYGYFIKSYSEVTQRVDGIYDSIWYHTKYFMEDSLLSEDSVLYRYGWGKFWEVAEFQEVGSKGFAIGESDFYPVVLSLDVYSWISIGE